MQDRRPSTFRASRLLLAGVVGCVGCNPADAWTATQVAELVADAGTNADADADADSSCAPSPACPQAEPAEGDSCNGGACEYGDDPWVQCNRIYECTMGRFRRVTLLPPDASECPSSVAPACPATRGSVPVGGACDDLTLRCAYAEGDCACGLHAPDSGAWWCAPTADSGCPSSHPRLGTPCSTGDSKFCSYQTTCGFGGVGCYCGAWWLQPENCPPPPPPPLPNVDAADDGAATRAMADATSDASWSRDDAQANDSSVGDAPHGPSSVSEASGCSCDTTGRHSNTDPCALLALAFAGFRIGRQARAPREEEEAPTATRRD